jgi:hypothetical protein
MLSYRQSSKDDCIHLLPKCVSDLAGTICQPAIYQPSDAVLPSVTFVPIYQKRKIMVNCTTAK